MCALNELLNNPVVRNILSNDFKCGYAAATLVFILVVLAVMIAKFLIFIAFRARKCSEVIVSNESGNLVISSRVISSLVSRELAKTGRFEDAKVVIREKSRKYLICIKASYAEGESGLPEISESLKPQILELLKQQFGIDNVQAITFSVERLAENSEEDADTGL